MTTFERDIIYHGTEVFLITIKRNLVNVLKENKSVTTNGFGNVSMPIFDKFKVLPKLGRNSFLFVCFWKLKGSFVPISISLRTKIWRYKDASFSQPDNATETFPVF